MTGPDRPVRQPPNTRASVLPGCFLRLAAFPCMREARTFISARGGGDRERRTPRARPVLTSPSSTFQGRFPAAAARSVGGSSGRSVVHTPRDRETGRPRAAQFAPWAVYIPGGGTTWCGRKERRMVTADLLSRARAGDGEAFRELAESHRRELQVHCYRMLGSVHDAEDAVQETMLAAWQGIGGFAEERASLRTWLYKIATNRCLNARRATSRRPVREWDMSQFEAPVPTPRDEPVWLQPFPDAFLRGRRRPAARAGGPLRADRSHLAGLRNRPAAATSAPARRPHPARRPRIPCQRGSQHDGGDHRIGQQRPETSPR